MDHVSSRLAARRGISQVETLIRADAIALLADRESRGAWRELLAVLASGGAPEDIRRRSRPVLVRLAVALHNATLAALGKLAVWAHGRAVDDVLATVPHEWLAAMVPQHVPVKEDEAGGAPNVSFLSGLWPGVSDLAELPDVLRGLLFPPPDRETVDSILAVLRLDGQSVRDRMRGAIIRFDPDRIADQLAASYAQGKTQREIAKDLLPAVNNLRTSAARVARTYGVAVAGAMARRVDDQLGDLSAGVQVHATLDQHTRTNAQDILKDHRRRDGFIFWKHPQPGEYGMDKAPSPPMEYDHTTAWNCRCYTTPVLRPPSWANNQAKLAAFATAPVPDPAVYADWFASADERRRRLAVGAKRYSTLAAKLGRKPSYADFLDETGRLLPTDQLKAETATQRAKRVAKVNAEIAHRRQVKQDVARLGFVPA